MLNLNSLYKAVFKPEYQRFDPVKNYYTIVMDTATFAPLYPEFRDRIEYLLSADSYTYLHTPEDGELSRDTVEETLSEVTETLDMRTNNANYVRRYCLIAYFDDDHRDTGDLMRRISWLHREKRDVLTLLVCLSKRMTGKIAFLEDLSRLLMDKEPEVDFYVFTDGHTAYYRRSLIHSLCGAVVMNTEIAGQSARRRRQEIAVSTVSQYVTNLSQTGREQLTALTPIRWSTLFCRYYDRKFDFLYQYISEACERVKTITQEDFVEFVNEIYRQLIPNRDVITVKSAMLRSVEQIPFVVPAPPKQALSSLRSYIDSVYGDRGVDTLGLSLKATLSGIYNYRVDDLAEKGSNMLFEMCASFGDQELDETVCRELDGYIKGLQDACVSAQMSVNQLLDADMLASYLQGSLEEYVDKYLRFYEAQKRCDYWTEVRRRIRAYPEHYTAYAEQSTQTYRQLFALRESIPTTRVYQFDKLAIPELTTGQLMQLESNEDLCDRIRHQFNECRDDNSGVASPKDCAPVFSISVSPQFNKLFDVELSNKAYTICGKELNGQYFVSMGDDPNA